MDLKELKRKIRIDLTNNMIVSIKTNTVFGLFALPSKRNCRAINLMKEREIEQPVQLVVSTFPQLDEWTSLSKFQLNHILKNISSTTSFIVPLNPEKRTKILSHDGTVMVRWIDIYENKELFETIEEVGPLVGSSANIHFSPELNDPEEIRKTFRINVIGDKIYYKTKPSKMVSLIGDKVDVIRK